MTNTAFYCGVAGGLSILLLVFLAPVTEALIEVRRDLAGRSIRIFLFLLVGALALLPGAVFLVNPEGSFWLLFYVVFFSLFCYHLGKRIGAIQGETRIRELVGLDSAENIEDAQDRLFESRLRFPNRAEVVKSIGALAKRDAAARQEAERQAVGRPPSPPASSGPGIPHIDLTAKHDADARQ